MRSYRSTKRLSEIIHQKHTITGRLLRKAELLQQINTMINQLLPPSMYSKAQAANISRTEVVIHLSSATLLTRFRLLQTTLIERINSTYDWAQVDKITLKVRPIKPPKTKAETTSPKHSDQAAQYVADAATLCHHPDLRNSLQQLAQHLARRPRQNPPKQN